MGGVPAVLLKEYKYFPNGNLKQKIEYIDPNDPNRKRVTDYIYDSNGFNLEETIVNAGTGQIRTVYAYDNLGRKETETLYRQTSPTNTALLQLTTTYEYDDLDRVRKVTNPSGDISETVYDGNGNVVQEIMHFKKPTTGYDVRTVATHEYDNADRRIKTIDVNSNETTFTYDANGNLIAKTDALGHTTRNEYDTCQLRSR